MKAGIDDVQGKCELKTAEAGVCKVPAIYNEKQQKEDFAVQDSCQVKTAME